jgi:hypothetical protein
MAVTMNYGAAPTYVKIASYTTPGTTASYTFTNIPQGYTDLVLVTAGVGSGTENLECYINGDTGNNYSFTYIYGDGTTAASGRNANTNRIVVGRLGTTVSHGIAHFQNYSSSQMRKTVLTRKGKGNEIAMLFSNVWLSNNPITSLQIFGAGSPAKTMSAGYTISLYGIKAAFVPKATGGDIVVQDGTYWYHAFRTTGGFTPRQALTCDVVTIAGGGSGGWPYSPGGGAGGLLYSTSQSMSAGTTYVCSVGAGGAGFYGGGGANGANSTVSASGFTTLTAVGGGGANASGGSGGGGLDADSGTRSAPAGTAGQGNAGGLGGTAGGNVSGGGGGGAGGAGGAASGTGTAAGAGGVGSSSYSSWGIATGTGHNVSGTIFYAGGGGGGTNAASSVAGAGSSGGGGRGASNDSLRESEAGMANTGGGSGGGAAGAAKFSPKSGGSGLIIVRYPI